MHRDGSASATPPQGGSDWSIKRAGAYPATCLVAPACRAGHGVGWAEHHEAALVNREKNRLNTSNMWNQNTMRN